VKWEYKIETLGLEHPLRGIVPPERILNKLGEEGWEAVAILRNPEQQGYEDRDDTLVLFKRPISK